MIKKIFAESIADFPNFPPIARLHPVPAPPWAFTALWAVSMGDAWNVLGDSLPRFPLGLVKKIDSVFSSPHVAQSQEHFLGGHSGQPGTLISETGMHVPYSRPFWSVFPNLGNEGDCAQPSSSRLSGVYGDRWLSPEVASFLPHHESLLAHGYKVM